MPRTSPLQQVETFRLLFLRVLESKLDRSRYVEAWERIRGAVVGRLLELQP